MLAYGDMKDTDEGKRSVARRIVEVLAGCGLEAKWSGDVTRRIEIQNLAWLRRFGGA